MNAKKMFVALLSVLQVFTFSFSMLDVEKVQAETGKYMVAPPVSSYVVADNFKVVSGMNSYFDTTNKNVVVITNNVKNQRGAVWSKFQFNMTQNFEIKAAVYWGKSTDAPLGVNQTQPGGDGMTITFQNDPRGQSAIGGIAGGLGAYKRPSVSTDTHIENALSFELDPYVNKNAGEFDEGLQPDLVTPNNGRHVGFVYPNDPLGISKHYSMQTFTQAGINEDIWMPLNIKWTAGANNSGTFSVTLGSNVMTHNVSNYQTVFGGSRAYFGFTGGTGGATALQAVAIDSMPGMYLLNYDLNGATGTPPNSEYVNFGELSSQITPPTRTGYTFLGWNTAANGSGIMWDYETSIMPANNVKLYAQWILNSYTLNYNLNGGSSSPPILPELVPYQSLATPVAPPIREGYTFTGWNTDANGTGIDLDYSTTVMPANNVVVYAQWSINPYQLSYDLNGATGTPPATQTLIYQSLATQVVNPIRAGYIFNSWNTEKDGTGVNWDFETTRMPGNDTTLYAQWVQLQYNLTYELNGGEGEQLNGQSIPLNGLAAPIADPTRIGYTFLGWNTEQDGSGMYWDFATTTMPENSVVLHAQWSINKYTVDYDTNGAEITPPQTQIVEYQNYVNPVPDPVREGYIFVGWNTKSDGSGMTVDFTTTTMPASNMKLYSIWSVNYYTVIYETNNEARTLFPFDTVAFETFLPSLDDPIYFGHKFLGWNTKEDGSGIMWDFTTMKMPATDMILHAQWKLNKHVLSYKLNGGIGFVPSQTVNYSEYVTPVADPLKDGYRFIGWNTSEDGNGIMWDFTTMKMPDKDIVLYAIYYPLQSNDSNLVNTGLEPITKYIFLYMIVLSTYIILKKRIEH